MAASEDGAAASENSAGAIPLTVTSRLPRMEMHPHQNDIGDSRAGASTPVVLEFERPLHLQMMAAWMILSIAAIAACVVFLSSVEALIASAAGLVLAVWGIRGILLGSLIPATSAVDSALAIIVVLVLMATLVRIVWLFETRSRMRVLSRLPRVAPAGSPPSAAHSDPRPPDFWPGASGAP